MTWKMTPCLFEEYWEGKYRSPKISPCEHRPPSPWFHPYALMPYPAPPNPMNPKPQQCALGGGTIFQQMSKIVSSPSNAYILAMRGSAPKGWGSMGADHV